MKTNTLNTRIIGDLVSSSVRALSLLGQNDQNFDEFTDCLFEAISGKAIVGNVQLADAWLRGEDEALCVEFKLSPYFLRHADNQSLQLDMVTWMFLLPMFDNQWARGKRVIDWIKLGKLILPSATSAILNEDIVAKVAAAN